MRNPTKIVASRTGPILAVFLVVLCLAPSVALAKVTVDFWDPFVGSLTPYMQKLVDEYNSQHSDVFIDMKEVENLTAAGNSDKFLTAVAAGTPPDVIIQDSAGFVPAIRANFFEPLDAYAAADGIGAAMYVPFAWQRVIDRGKLWGLPFTADSRAMFVNTEMTDAAGVSTSSLQTTEDLVSASRKLSKSDGSKWTQLGFLPWVGNWFLSGWNFAFGGDVYDYATDTLSVNNDRMVEALTWEQQEFGLRYGLSAAPRWNGLFLQKRLAMYIEVCNFPTYLTEAGSPVDWQAVPVPHGPQGTTTTWSGMWALVIPRGAKHRAEAWDFIKWMSGPRGQAAWANLIHEIPTVRVPDRSYSLPAKEKLFLDLLAFSHGEPSFPEWGSIFGELDGLEQQVLSFKVTPKAGLDDIQKRYTAKIKERLAKK